MIIPYKPKIITALLLTIILVTALSFFFFMQLDKIVNVDLYDYGLTFNNGWADQYSLNSRFYVYSAIIVVILFINSIAFFLTYNRNRNTIWSSISSLLLLIAGGLTFFNIYFLYKLDSIVNNNLYFYGLRFSAEWYSDYSLYYSLLLLFAIFAGILAIASAALIYNSANKVRIVPPRILDSTLIAIGSAALAFSIVYTSSTLALIGLSLLFWGITFTYISTDEYVKKILLETAVSAQQTTLNRMIEKLDYRGNPIYLPPQFFNNSDTYKAYITKDEPKYIPKPSMFPKKEPDLIEFTEDSSALVITPPGAELAQLFETTLNKDLTETNLRYLQQKLPELIVEDLEVSPYFEMEIEKDTVRIRMEDSYFSVPNQETKPPSVQSLFDSPLSNAIACILAKASHNPVMRMNVNPDAKDKYLFEYRILTSEKQLK